MNFRLYRDAAGIVFFSVLVGLAANQFRSDGLSLAPVPPAEETVSGAETISPSRALELHRTGEALFVDARPEAYYAAGHIRGAENFPDSTFDRWIDRFLETVSPDRTIVVYCSDPICPLARELTQKLAFAGFENLRYFPGGWEAWKRTDYPAEP